MNQVINNKYECKIFILSSRILDEVNDRFVLKYMENCIYNSCSISILKKLLASLIYSL